jgi:UTP--glucose-1-phosphate uridylyltransferase
MLWGDYVADSQPPCLQQLLPVFETYGASVGAALRVAHDDVSKYGVYAAQEVAPRTYRVAGIVEKPAPQDAPSNLAAVRGYILTPEVFDLLARTAPGRGGELWLTDALNPLAKQGRLYAYAFEGQSTTPAMPWAYCRHISRLPSSDPISVPS